MNFKSPRKRSFLLLMTVSLLWELLSPPFGWGATQKGDQDLVDRLGAKVDRGEGGQATAAERSQLLEARSRLANPQGDHYKQPALDGQSSRRNSLLGPSTTTGPSPLNPNTRPRSNSLPNPSSSPLPPQPTKDSAHPVPPNPNPSLRTIAPAGSGSTHTLPNTLPPVPPPLNGTVSTDPSSAKRGSANSFFQSRSSDQCRYSAQIDGKYACSGEQQTLQTMQMMQMGSMMTGSLGVQATGGMQATSAMNANTQKAALEAMGTTNLVSGGIQATAATGTTLLGSIMIHRARKRHQLGTELGTAGSGGLDTVQTSQDGSNAKERMITNATDAGYVSSTNQTTNSIINKYQINQELSNEKPFTVVRSDKQHQTTDRTARDEEAKNHQADVQRAVADIASNARAEQDGIATMGLMSGVMTLGQGINQMASAGGMIAQGALMKQAAARLSTPTQAPVILPRFQSGSATAGGGLRTAAITGSGTGGNTLAETKEIAPNKPGPDLGPGFNPGLPPTGVSGAPIPGSLQNAPPGTGGSATGTPVGAGAGGGLTAAEKPAEEEKATTAPNSGSPLYQSGSGSSFAKAGGGGGNPKDNLDLSGILAKFLPQKEDLENRPQNGILSFDSTATADPNQGIQMQRDRNIFKMVEEAMIRNHQSGKI